MSHPDRRVLVTGMGAVCATGHDVEGFIAGLQAGVVGIGPIANIPTTRLSARIAGEIHGFDPAQHFAPRQLPLLDRVSQLGVVAARQALAQSGLEPAERQDAAIVFGAAIGHQSLDAVYEQLYGEGAERVHPFTVPRTMPNAPASHISMAFGVHGPCFAVASACASANHAIGQAALMVRSGMVDVAITGGSDASLAVGVFKAWEALRVLSADACRPFSRNRSGLVLGEGAGVLVLESAGHARARGATGLAEVAGFGMSADGHDITAPDGDGAVRAMMAALADAGCAADGVGYVNAHGTGTRLNDRMEVAALRRVFGAHADRLLVSSTKSMIGHCLAAGGALELIATISALRDGVVPPTAGFTEFDPECAIDCVPNVARAASVEVALSNAFAFGGLNAVLAARRWEG